LLDFRFDDATPLTARGEVCVSRGEMRAIADALYEALRAGGMQRAMVLSDDPADILRALDACARAGADLFIAHTNLSEAHIEEIVEAHGVECVISEVGDVARANVSGGNARAQGAGRVFMMTSGTTGAPKIAEHSLESLLARARLSGRGPNNTSGKWLLTYQPTGFAGVQVILTAAMTNGLIVSPLQRNPSGFFEAAKSWQVSQISGTPTFWRSFLMAASPQDLALKQITLGGEASDQATLDRVKKAFPEARITHVYASTEAGVVFAVHDGQAGFPAEWLTEDGRESVKPGAQVRIRDGYLQIKTANSLRGYLSMAEQPMQGDGWLATADLCEIRGERVHILGRQDSTINVGGSKVYPLAVESVLLSLPGVAEARVYGVPNPVSGALVGADVVLDAGEDPAAARPRILAACREQLAGYQVPRVFKIVDAIASSASGKKG
jgi:acyl-coenzyme A synthetase/AMP-(fatty) acid ligase